MKTNVAEHRQSATESPAPGAKYLGLAIILLAAFAAVAPLLISGNSCGHDIEFHLTSWVDVLHIWRQGIVYPQWKPSSNFFAGEPRFIFYPPLSLMAGALLGAALPWHYVPIAMIFLLLAATGLATRALARQTMGDTPATIAGCAAMLFGYAIFTAYVRSDYAEMTGGFWIPLLLLFALRDRNPSGTILRRAFDGSAAPLALIVAGAWLSNPPVGVMSSYLLAAVALTSALIDRSWAAVLRAGVAAALGLAMAAIYWVPAVSEQRWANLPSAIEYDRIEDSWIFAWRHSGNFGAQDRFLRWVAVIALCMIAIALTGLLVSRLRGTIPGKLRWWFPLAAIPAVVLFLQFPISLPVWNLVPKLRYLQFPFRWLVTVEAPMGIFFASAVWTGRARRQLTVVSICAVLFLINVLAARRFFLSVCTRDWSIAAFLAGYRTRALIDDDKSEYAPPSAHDGLIPIGLPDACLTGNPSTALGKRAADGTLVWKPSQGTCQATYSADTPKGAAPAEHLRVRARIDRPGFLVLRLRTYPAWLIRVNGKTICEFPERHDGLIAVPVPQGPVTLTVDWTATPDVIAARCLSLFAVLLLVSLWRFERKLTGPRSERLQAQPA